MNRPGRSMGSRGSRGVVLMGLMVLLALGGLAAVQFAESAATSAQREKEQQLLWVGQQYQQALESYYRATPGPVKHLPLSLNELARDSRFPQPVRHLRRVYPDPLQPDVPWGLVRRGNQIVGVYSQSEGQPLKRREFGAGLEGLEMAAHYADWRFTFVPRGPSIGPSTGPSTPTGPNATPAPSTPSSKKP